MKEIDVYELNGNGGMVNVSDTAVLRDISVVNNRVFLICEVERPSLGEMRQEVQLRSERFFCVQTGQRVRDDWVYLRSVVIDDRLVHIYTEET